MDYRWEPACFGQVPAGAVPHGRDVGGEPLWVCRAQIGGGLHPGKVRPGLGGANVSFGGGEHRVRAYEVLMTPGEWVPGRGGEVPPGAYLAGHEATGADLYVARAPVGGGDVQLGKVRAGLGGASIAFAGEQHVNAYQVLVGPPVRELPTGVPPVPPPSVHVPDPAYGEPPATWREHWHEHDQTLRLLRFDEHAAIWVDRDVDANRLGWALPWVSDAWRYSKQVYGGLFGRDPRLHAVFHQGRYGGGHPATYFGGDHDCRNVSDCGPGPWHEHPGVRGLPSHEISHVVEFANNGVSESPAFEVWGDSKWAEFFGYDLARALGDRDAGRIRAEQLRITDDFPRAGVFWFRDWFLPMWEDRQGPQTMARFFALLAGHFPREADGVQYARRMNWGEYLHFTSAAAGGDLTQRAVQAFGVPGRWGARQLPDAWLAQLDRARTDFPRVNR